MNMWLSPNQVIIEYSGRTIALKLSGPSVDYPYLYLDYSGYILGLLLLQYCWTLIYTELFFDTEENKPYMNQNQKWPNATFLFHSDGWSKMSWVVGS